MPIVPNAKSAAEFTQGHGVNDLIRRTLFPGFPGGQCVKGNIFFPWGTGPTFPVLCDRDFVLQTIPGGVGTQFVTKPGSTFVKAVAELASVSAEEAERAVAHAAGVDHSALQNMTVLEVGRKIFERALPKIQVKHTHPAHNATVGQYLDSLAKVTGDDNASMVRDLAAQTGLSAEHLKKLDLSELGNYVDMVGSIPGQISRSGSLLCATANGTTRCGIVHGAVEGAIWGGLIGGAIGGGLGAFIGGLIGAFFGWLF